jgi:tetratricopeptide (TPR) repeat protein
MSAAGHADEFPGAVGLLPQDAGVRPQVAGGPRTGVQSVAVLLLLLLAFFLASSPANNSDFWLHLATGRALVHGDYQFGSEPFTYANPDSYWVNPTWLYDVVLFFVSRVLGNSALVMIKGILVVALAVFLLATGSMGKSRWLAIVAVALALVAMGPWLALKPMSLSFLFLGFTAWFLERHLPRSPGDGLAARDGKPVTFFSFAPLLVLFAFWANLDGWFFLGPLMVALYFLGEAMDRRRSTAGEEGARRPGLSWKTWGWLLAASLAACALNPHHLRIYEIPLQHLGFSEVGAELAQDSFFRSQFLAPFRDVYFSRNTPTYPPGIAFWLLVFLGVLSLVFHTSSWPWRWRLAWIVFFCLCLFQTQWIPFFAIVAAPVLARTIERYASRSAARSTPGGLRLARSLSFLGLLLLTVAAWPGWLQLGSPGPREWRVQMDAGIEQVAAQMAEAQARGTSFAGGRGLFFSPETANCFAWLVPQEKGFVNSHFHLTPRAAADFLIVREGLTGQKALGAGGRQWREILRENRVNHLVIHSHDFRSSAIVMNTLLAAYKECPLLFLKGHTAVFGWRDPEKAGSANQFAGAELDLRRRAFADDAAHGPLPETTLPGSRKPFWWEAFWRPRQQSSVAVNEALVLLDSFDSLADTTGQRNQFRWEGIFVTGLLAQLGSAEGAAWTSLGRVGVVLPGEDAFVQSQDDGPLENLFLALRAAREAVHRQPNNPQGFLLLGEAYYRLSRHSRERVWYRGFPLLGKIRTAQALMAFRQAAHLDPHSLPAHTRLAEIYQGMDYKDLTLAHLEKVLPLVKKAGSDPKKAEALEKAIADLKQQVGMALSKYDSIAPSLRVEGRAFLAGRHGLAGKALEVLLASELAAFGKKGLEMEVTLLLNTGQSDAVLDWLKPDHESLLGVEKYHWLRAQAEASSGRYDDADQDLRSVVVTEIPGKVLKRPVDLALVILGNTLLMEGAGGPLKTLPLPLFWGMPLRAHLPARVHVALDKMNDDAKMMVVRGMLALEAGRTREALEHFRAALAFWTSPAGTRFADASCRTCRRICAFFLEQAASKQALNRQHAQAPQTP